MSVQLLDKTRKINKLLHNNNSSKVVFNDICKVLSETLDSNVLVISHKGKVLGVSICDDIDEITENLKEVLPDVLHLSGNIEGISPDEVMELKRRFPGLKIMQAIPVLQNVPIEEQKALEYIKQYEAVSDFFLIDTKADTANDIGATGLTHDRSIDRAIIESTSVPCIIAGGLDASNVAEAIHETHPYGVDSFSLTNFDQVEEGKGCKDPEKVKAFIEASLNA